MSNSSLDDAAKEDIQAEKPIAISSETLLSQLDNGALFVRGWAVKVKQDVLTVDIVKMLNGHVTLEAYSGDSKITQQPWVASNPNAFLSIAELIKAACLELTKKGIAQPPS